MAVTVGVRLDDGGLSFQAALTVLILAPELYLPLRTVGTLYHTVPTGWRWQSGCCRSPAAGGIICSGMRSTRGADSV